ncbi:MAG: Inositol 2-dehydrogenase/D-chiro-inositol 3-dehydrogenase [Verrucomicrobiae bacterium]|nr:Inositol 2-dehydrogenase/D-chiro-inositol 3-dehydrogenase [Verrucomicrobiae bacterium]
MALKVGIIGLRGIGETHARAHSQNPLAKLVAVCDVVKERADKAAAQYGGKAYASPAEMLRNEDLDVVDVCTGGYENGGWHFEPVMAALAAGKNVLVEKPISNDIHEAREMVRFAAEKDVYLGCNLNHYFTEPARQARQLMTDGKIGEPVYCLHRMGFIGGEDIYKPGGGPNFDGFPYAHLKAFLAHPFSLMRHFGGDITHVQAFMDRPSVRRHAGDLMMSIASVHVKFHNGAIGYLFSSRGDATMGLGGWWSFEFGGSKGTFCIENCVEKLTYYPAPAPTDKLGLGEQPTPVVTNTGVKDFGATFPARINAYLEDVTNQVPKSKLRASGRDALATLEYTFAAIESYEQGGALVRPHALPTLKRDLKDQ